MNKKNFLDDMKYIDGITIIDKDGVIQYSIKFNPTFYPEHYGREDVIGKKLDEIFVNLSDDDSTLFDSMKKKTVVSKRKQKITNTFGDEIETMNISMPIMAGETVMGAIELSKNVTNEIQRKNKILKIEKDIFNHSIKYLNRFESDKARYELDSIISNNSMIADIKYRIARMKKAKAPVFIYGETGTGKELVAHSIHNAGDRKDKPFISQNCAAIPENLLESILFGTVKGSYTGAVDAPGLFELADGGTLFLDEINSMPISLQSKMLRVLENGFIRRLGGSKEKKFDVCIVCASNEKPLECVDSGKLRRDIYYRLCVIYFEIPPLRQRVDDISLLTNYFVSKYNYEYERNISEISDGVMEKFLKYDWPGNVRELEHIIQYALTQVNSSDVTIDESHIENRLGERKTINKTKEEKIDFSVPLNDMVGDLEKRVIDKALEKTGGNVSKAAELLKIPRQTLARKIKLHK